MRRIIAFIISLCIFHGTIMLDGCGPAESRADIYGYQTTDAVYSVSFADENISGELEKRGAIYSLLITSPDSISGIKVTYDGNVCRLCSGNVEIPLSADAASGLTPLFSLMDARTDGVAAKSSDGLSTVITFGDGKVTLCQNDGEFAITEISIDTESCKRRVIFEPSGK